MAAKSYKITLLVLVLMLVTLACGFGKSITATATPAVKKATATQVVKATAVPEATEEVEATEEPVVEEPTEEPAVDEVTPEEETSSNEMSEAWRIPAFEGATLLAYDQTPNINQDIIAVMDKQARNLAIPKPYYFEVYDLPDGTKFPAVKSHYDQEITSQGMRRAFDEMGQNGIAVVTWTDPSVKNKKYLIQYIPADPKYPPMVFIIYSHPE